MNWSTSQATRPGKNGYFGRLHEDGRSEEFMDLPLVLIAQPDGFRRERAGNDPANRDGGVKDVLHASSSS